MPFSSRSRFSPKLWGVCLGLALLGASAAFPAAPAGKPAPGRGWDLIPVDRAGTPAEKKPAAPPRAPEAPTPPARQAALQSLPATQFESDDESARPTPKHGPRVAMIDFESTTLGQDPVKALSQALWTKLDASPNLALFPRASTRRWLIRHDLFPFTPYQAPVSPDRITGAIRADYLLTGHIEQLGGILNLDLSVYSRQAKKFILQDFRLEKTDWNALQDSFTPLARQLAQAILSNEAALGMPAAPPASAPAVEHAPETAQPRKLASPTPEKTAPPVRHVTVRVRNGARLARKGAGATAESKKGALSPGLKPAAPSPAEHAPAPHTAPRPEKAPETERPKEASGAATLIPATTPEPRPATRATPTPRPAARPAATPPAKPAPTAAAAAEEASGPARAKALYEEALQLPETRPERLAKLTQAAELAPRDGVYQQQLALDQFNRGDYKGCIARVDKALKALPDNSMLLTIQGSAYIATGDYNQAAHSHLSALKADPGNCWAAYNLALALGLQHSPKAAPAWKHYLSMAEKNPDQQELVGKARKSLAELEGGKK